MFSGFAIPVQGLTLVFHHTAGVGIGSTQLALGQRMLLLGGHMQPKSGFGIGILSQISFPDRKLGIRIALRCAGASRIALANGERTVGGQLLNAF